MNNTLELRSTFRFKEALSELPNLSIPKTLFSKKVKENLPKGNLKNKYAVATQMVQTLKDSMDDEMKSILESYVTKRLASHVKSTFTADDVLSFSSAEIEGYELGVNKDTCAHLKSKYFIRQGVSRGDVLFHLEGFVPSENLNAPKDATNFKISTKLISISNYQLDKLNNQYYPLAKDAHGIVEEHDTSMLPLIKIQTQPISVKLYMEGIKKEIENVNTVMVSAIKYYKYQDGKFEHLAENGCLSISKVL